MGSKASSSLWSEKELVQKPANDILRQLGYEAVDCFGEWQGDHSSIGRSTPYSVVIEPRLRAAIEHLNPGLACEVIDLAMADLTRDRSSMNPAVANREIYERMKDGVKVEFRSGDELLIETVKVVDWDNPANNHFFAASEFWVSGDIGRYRSDLVLFLNGLPIVLFEFKSPQEPLEHAFSQNVQPYKRNIPQLFWYNAFILVSNGTASRVGTVSSEWEYYSDWKKINDENEIGVLSLETIIKGTCDCLRLMDLLENFIVFEDMGGSMIKKFAKNHQYLGVNRAYTAVQHAVENRGRLGVFWHTQGSGKSLSMVFLSQKVLRKMPGNWTFLIVTDRDELDGQIFDQFNNVGAVTEIDVKAKSVAHLKRLLREDHRNVFTLIQKFQTREGELYPVLSERSDIIVITDEAHRSQYDILAMNMRTALPNASFIAFTGTQLIVGEEKTREVFGDYVSVYNFRQSIEDGATVPLYYENRIPELELTNKDLEYELQRIIDDAELDDKAEDKLARTFARQYHLITRDDRLEAISLDIVSHFMNRGFMGKAMVVSIDRLTAVRMYEKVKKHWADYLKKLQQEYASTGDIEEKSELAKKIEFMANTDMAVVISASSYDFEKFDKQGLNIRPILKRMEQEDLEKRFKEKADPFRLVFVCSMWITGFDVPPLSTIYLDRPMRDHALMQTIARANRVFGNKANGLIVDYVGIFRNLQRALAIYATGRSGDVPVQDKSKLVEELNIKFDELEVFARSIGIEVDGLRNSTGLKKLKLISDASEAILASDETKKRFVSSVGIVFKLYQSVLPDPAISGLGKKLYVYRMLLLDIKDTMPGTDISQLIADINKLLDRSISVVPIPDEPGKQVDISRLDLKAIEELLRSKKKRTAAEQLIGITRNHVERMVQLNKARSYLLERLRQMINDYNSGSMNVEQFLDSIRDLIKEMEAEEKRAAKENMSEEELAILDILTKPAMSLTDKDIKAVKKVTRDLLVSLKNKLVIDWRNRQQSRAEINVAIKEALMNLPDCYTPEMISNKRESVYQHIFDSYYGEGQSVYA